MQNLTLNFKLNLPATNLCIVQSIIHSDERDEVFCQLCMNDRMSSVLLGSDLESASAHGPTYKWYHTILLWPWETRKKSFRLYQKHMISSFNSLMHLLLESSALILLMTALLKPWTFSWSADDASFQVQGNILRKPSQRLHYRVDRQNYPSLRVMHSKY